MAGPSIAYVLDPRFPGGTSSAVAAELDVVSKLGIVTVRAVDTAMFKGQRVAPQLEATLSNRNIPLIWSEKAISADVVVFHNPSCLKFQDRLPVKILSPHLIVVVHENFLRPGGEESFDVRKCLTMLEEASFAAQRSIASISDWNRRTVEDWQRSFGPLHRWGLLEQTWFNICDLKTVPPSQRPKDRRGRHSRPGFEKFPTRGCLDLCFPPHAESNILLGADGILEDFDVPPHWVIYPFRSLTLEAYFAMIDFMVYFTAPTLRESYGRVLVEAVAAGKIAITDPETASPFDGAVLSAQPHEVDGLIQSYLENPSLYAQDVEKAQKKLTQFSPESFAHMFKAATSPRKGSNV